MNIIREINAAYNRTRVSRWDTVNVVLWLSPLMIGVVAFAEAPRLMGIWA